MCRRCAPGAGAVLAADAGRQNAGDAPAATGRGAASGAGARRASCATTILWPYADALAVFGGWWRQFWAESLGKDGKGSTPVSALGPVDQHSQLQLFRDGPGNALFTLVRRTPRARARSRRDARRSARPRLSRRQALGDLVAAEARATAQTLFKNGRPVRADPSAADRRTSASAH